ncbi:MAG TPA: PAC2 family protein [Acidimicrobiia bacterium]
MDLIEWRARPELEEGAAILAFEGWGDASTAASTAGEFLIREVAEPFASIDPESFFDFQMQRPTVQIDGGGTRRVIWPGVEFHLAHFFGKELIVVLGEEPHLRWRTFATVVLDALRSCGVSFVLTFGAFIGRVAHTLPVPIFGVATDTDLIERHGLLVSDYQGPTGIVGTLHDKARRGGIPALSLWAAVPHYLAANHNPKVSYALLEKASEVLDLDLDLSDLEHEVENFERRVNEAMKESEDLLTYIRQLEVEGSQPAMNPQSTDELITEIEQFLKDT